MTYQVLARKWRPKKFADLVGQEHVVKALVNALNNGHLHHAYLLTGTRGVGKTTIARILAKSLNCRFAVAGEPCGQCDSCVQIDAGRFVDVLEIDAASNTGIDNIREVLDNAQYAPTIGQCKVYIIDEVHMLSKSAFNAMLKTLEEPPAHVKFILATTDPQKVPVTVLSRCLQFVLRNLSSTQVHQHLIQVLQTEQLDFEDAGLSLLSRAAAGSMRDALSLLDQAIALGSGQVTQADVRQMLGAVDKAYLYQLLTALATGDGQALIAKAAEMTAQAIGFDHVLNELALLLQQLSLMQLVPEAVAADEPDKAVLSQLTALFSAEQLQLYYQCALRGKADLPLAPDEYAGFVMTLLRMLAFAPLAAETHALNAQIEQTELHNPGHSAVSAEAVTAAVAEPTTVTAMAEQAPVTLAATTPPQTITHHEATTPMPEVATNTGVVEKKTPVIAPASQTEKEDVLPPLAAANWDIILKKLSPKLGAVQLFSQHTAIATFDQASGDLTLALTEQGLLTADKKRLERLANILSAAYQVPIQIHTCEWHNEETPQMRQQRQQLAQQQQAQQLLEADDTIRYLMATFEATWLPHSLQLKSH